MSARASEWAWGQDPGAGQKLTLLALANEATSDGVVAGLEQAEVAARTGAKPRTVREHLATLEGAGLIARAPQFEQRRRVADLIVLAVPDHPSVETATGRIRRAVSSSTPPPRERKDEVPGEIRPTGAGLLAAAPKVTDLPDELYRDAAELIARKTKVDGRIVNVDEMVTAANAIDEFNRRSGSEFGLGAHLRPVVMRIRERPSYDADAHRRLVQSAWRVKWWERSGSSGRKPTPAVVYGNSGCFERCVQDAVDERKGEQPDGATGGTKFRRRSAVQREHG